MTVTVTVTMFQQREYHQSHSSITVHDGYATIRRTPYTCRARLPQSQQYSLDTVLEEPPAVAFRPKPDIPWWEIATRRSKYHSCSDLQVQMYSIWNVTVIIEFWVLSRQTGSPIGG